MGIDHAAAWAEFEEVAASIKDGKKDFLTWEDGASGMRHLTRS